LFLYETDWVEIHSKENVFANFPLPAGNFGGRGVAAVRFLFENAGAAGRIARRDGAGLSPFEMQDPQGHDA